ncbi:ABC transporter permease [Nigerium massiliense]|uniref:ABC transporter permease n=1 Tax=Nigerium massiliense TaxID=1522317 RepID=UPI00058D2C18|nr:ABC transporter permease [Nigerium massiliense]
MSRRRAIGGLVCLGLGLLGVAVGAIVHLTEVAVVGGLLSVAGVALAAPVVFPGVASVLAPLGGSRSVDVARTMRTNPRRVGASALAVWFGIMLVTTLLVASATSAATLSRAVDEGSPTDVIVTPSGPATTLVQRLSLVPSVASAAPVKSVMIDATMGGRTQLITVAAWTPELASVLRATATAPQAGTIGLPPSSTASTGDDVVLTRRGENLTLRAVVAPGAPGMGIVDAHDYSALRDSSDPAVWVKLKAGTDERAAVDTIREVAGPAAPVSSPAIQRAEILDQMREITVGASVLLGAIILIALAGMANTLTLAVMERTREFGLLRALGALRRQVVGMVLTESVLTTGAATLLGLILGVCFGLGGVLALLSGEQLQVVPTIPWLGLLGTAVASIPCALVAALAPARRAASIPPIAALAGSE